LLVYIAGPYRGGVDKNIAIARKAAIAVWESGNVAICPHLNTAHFEVDCKCQDEVYLSGDLNILARCDAILMLEGWEQSEGSQAEYLYAKQIGLFCYYWPTIPELHPTEIKSPIQCRAFREYQAKMYITHLIKNQDYSPANILGTGEIGLVTRLWDKIARLMNLTGFDVTIAKSSFDKPKEAKNESIDDTYLDLANYGLIGKLLRDGKWGR